MFADVSSLKESTMKNNKQDNRMTGSQVLGSWLFQATTKKERNKEEEVKLRSILYKYYQTHASRMLV